MRSTPSREDAISGSQKPRRQARQTVRIHAPAKINLILKILDRRQDGYHNLWSLMQTVEVADELLCSLRRDRKDLRVRVDGASLPTDERNLVTRAARLMLDRAPRPSGLEIHLRKVLPVGGGLGGGSSDAAATLLAANELLQLGVTLDEMQALGEDLGSDVPFFFRAPAAIVTGRGEHVKPVRLVGERWVLLVRPAFQVQTRWAFARLAECRGAVIPLSEPLRALAEREEMAWDEVIPLMENDFEAALAPHYPAFRDIKSRLRSAGAEAALLSGSGSTVFGLFKTESEADRARVSMDDPGYWMAAGRASNLTLRCAWNSPSAPVTVC